MVVRGKDRVIRPGHATRHEHDWRSADCESSRLTPGWTFSGFNWHLTMPIRLLLLLVRSSLAVRLLRGRQLLWLDQRMRLDYEHYIPVILGALVTSRSPRNSERLLSCLATIPREVLERNQTLRSYFVRGELGSSSVSRAISICREAVRLCFYAK